MNLKKSLPRGSIGLLAGVFAVGLLVWGGRHAYCHFYGSMAEARADIPRTSTPRVPTVSVVAPIHEPAVRAVTLTASVDAFDKATLYTKVSGYLEWIKVDRGDWVKKGQVIAHIGVPEIEKEDERAQAAADEAEASSSRARAVVGLKEITYQRLEGIRSSQPDVISQQDVDVARSEYEVARNDVKVAEAKLQLARAEVGRLKTLVEFAYIRSPYDGVVTARFADPGALIQAGASGPAERAALVTVMDMCRVRVIVDIPEPDVARTHRGDPAEVRFDGLPGKVFRGKITRFATALDPQTRTMRAEIDFENHDHTIRPGMFGQATLKLEEEASALFLPAQALRVGSDGKHFVFVVSDGRVRAVPVNVGLDDGRQVQVMGLRGNETVVLSSPEKLEEGVAVNAVKAAS